jgi:hypothetical protein
VVEIVTKCPLGNPLQEWGAGGRNDPHVDLARSVAAKRAHATIFNDPKKLGLAARTHLGDFVEEESAILGRLK